MIIRITYCRNFGPEPRWSIHKTRQISTSICLLYVILQINRYFIREAVNGLARIPIKCFKEPMLSVCLIYTAGSNGGTMKQQTGRCFTITPNTLLNHPIQQDTVRHFRRTSRLSVLWIVQSHRPRKAHCFLACSGISFTRTSVGTPFSSGHHNSSLDISID